MNDRVTCTCYLIDIGADVSVLPAENCDRSRQAAGYKLYAANNTVIDPY